LICILKYAKNKFLSRATAIVVIGPRQIGKPFVYCYFSKIFLMQIIKKIGTKDQLRT